MISIAGIKYRAYKVSGNLNKYIGKSPSIKTPLESLKILNSTNASFARFGDGELSMLWGGNIGFQEYSPSLATRLEEILRSGSDDDVYIGLPGVFDGLRDYAPASRSFWRYFIGRNKYKIMEYVDAEKEYLDANVTRFWTGYASHSECAQKVRSFKSLWNSRHLVFVEGSKTRMGVGNDLFDNAKSVSRILAPCENAWDKYSEIFDACKYVFDSIDGCEKRDLIFLLALGPTATVLAYDLSRIGIRSIDIGHLDIQYEHYLRNADGKIRLTNKYFNEVPGGSDVTDDGLDESYLNSVLIDLSS